MQKKLQKNAAIMGLCLSDTVAVKMLDFLFLLQEWNTAYNLTAIRTLDKMLTHHLLDSLSLVPFFDPPLDKIQVLDIGSGAGFPGFPLAMYYPYCSFCLLDSNGKKFRFLMHVKNKMQLHNVDCKQERMELYRTDKLYDIIVCRAVGSISDIVENTSHLLSSSGKWIFMKGMFPADELKNLNFYYRTHAVVVPNIEAERHVVIVYKRGEANGVGNAG